MTEKKVAKDEKKVEPKFTKEQFLNAKEPIGNVDALYVVLEDNKTYTKKKAEELLKEFLEKEIKSNKEEVK